MTQPIRLVVLVSGTGSNLAALLEACTDAGLRRPGRGRWR